MTTPSEENGSSKISYSVRELLAEIKATVSNIDAKLDNKAEKVVVENLEKRLAAVEVERRTEREFGNSIYAEYKELLKEHTQVKLDITTLQTNKKDKEGFNLLWIPMIANVIGWIVVLLAGGIKIP